MFTLHFYRAFPTDNRLQVNQTHKNITVLENEWVTLECLVSNRTSPSSQLLVEWSVWRPGHSEKEAVAWLSLQGTLHYGDPAALGELRSRLHLESPAPGLFLLSIQNSTVRDSGAYGCRVEEWLLDPGERWYKRAEDISGLITLTVKQPGEGNLFQVPPASSRPVPSWANVNHRLSVSDSGSGHRAGPQGKLCSFLFPCLLDCTLAFLERVSSKFCKYN